MMGLGTSVCTIVSLILLPTMMHIHSLGLMLPLTLLCTVSISPLWIWPLDISRWHWKSDKEKIAFSMYITGHYEFNVMSFSLTNSPVTFQILMENALAGLTNERSLISLNNIIVFSSSFANHFTKASTYLHGIMSSTFTVEAVKVHRCQYHSLLPGTCCVCYRN